jgi:hypothetical protein
LIIYRRLSNNKERNINALWGQLACYIILDEKEKCYETLIKLKDNIDNNMVMIEYNNMILSSLLALSNLMGKLGYYIGAYLFSLDWKERLDCFLTLPLNIVMRRFFKWRQNI